MYVRSGRDIKKLMNGNVFSLNQESCDSYLASKSKQFINSHL